MNFLKGWWAFYQWYGEGAMRNDWFQRVHHAWEMSMLYMELDRIE